MLYIILSWILKEKYVILLLKAKLGIWTLFKVRVDYKKTEWLFIYISYIMYIKPIMIIDYIPVNFFEIKC